MVILQSLKIHMRKHLSEEQKKATAHVYKVCNKSYSSVGKLNEHQQKHEDIRCQYCNSTFAYIRTCKAHEKESCPQRPGVQPAEEGEEAEGEGAAAAPTPALKRWYCHICDSDYSARRTSRSISHQTRWAEVAKDANQ